MDRLLCIKTFLKHLDSPLSEIIHDISVDGEQKSPIENLTDYIYLLLSRVEITTDVAFTIQVLTDLSSFNERKFVCMSTVDSLERFLKIFDEKNYNGYFIYGVDYDYLSYLKSYYLETTLDSNDKEVENANFKMKKDLNKRLNSLVTGMLATTILFQIGCFSEHPVLRLDPYFKKFLTSVEVDRNILLQVIPYTANDLKYLGKSFRKGLIDLKNKYFINEREADKDYAELVKQLITWKASREVLKDVIECLMMIVMDAGFHFSDIFTYNIKLIVRRSFKNLPISAHAQVYSHLKRFENICQAIVVERVEYMHYLLLVIQSVISGASRICERRNYESCKIVKFEKKHKKATDLVTKTLVKDQLDRLTEDFEQTFGVLGKAELKHGLRKMQKLLLSITINFAQNMTELHKQIDENISTLFTMFSHFSVLNSTFQNSEESPYATTSTSILI